MYVLIDNEIISYLLHNLNLQTTNLIDAIKTKILKLIAININCISVVGKIILKGLAPYRWISPDTPVSFTCKIDHHDITEILLKVVLNTITLPPSIIKGYITFIFFLSLKTTERQSTNPLKIFATVVEC